MRNKGRIFFLLIFMLVNAGTQKFVPAQTIPVFLSNKYSLYLKVLEGFKAQFKGQIKEYQMEGDIKKGEFFIKEIGSKSPRLVFVIGPRAAQIAKQELKEDTTILVGMVINPFHYGLEGKNICGIYWRTAPQEQFKVLKEIAPSVKKIGVIYSSSYKEVIEEAKQAGYTVGLEIIEKEAERKADVAKAIKKLEGKIDAYWLLPDPVVANRIVFRKILLSTFTQGIPLVCPAQAFIKEGGMFSLDVNYEEMGKELGKIANQILSGKTSAQQLKFQYPKKPKLIINSKIIEKLGLTIPSSLLKKAEKVYE